MCCEIVGTLAKLECQNFMHWNDITWSCSCWDLREYTSMCHDHPIQFVTRAANFSLDGWLRRKKWLICTNFAFVVMKNLFDVSCCHCDYITSTYIDIHRAFPVGFAFVQLNLFYIPYWWGRWAPFATYQLFLRLPTRRNNNPPCELCFHCNHFCRDVTLIQVTTSPSIQLSSSQQMPSYQSSDLDCRKENGRSVFRTRHPPLYQDLDSCSPPP